MSVNTNKSQDCKKVTVRLSPEEYREIVSLAREGIRSMPQQLGFMAKTWLPMALKLCELYSCGTSNEWAVHFLKEYRKRERERGEYKKQALSKILHILTDPKENECPPDEQAEGARP